MKQRNLFQTTTYKHNSPRITSKDRKLLLISGDIIIFSYIQNVPVNTVKIPILRPSLGLSKVVLKTTFGQSSKVDSNQGYTGCRK